MKTILFATVVLLVLATTGPAFAAEPSFYSIDFVSTAAGGRAMNDQGIAAGVRYKLPAGCPPSGCAPISEVVVWSGDTVIALPLVSGFNVITPVNINSAGWVAGYAGDPTSTGAHAVVWKPTGTGYTAIDLGTLPGTSSSWAAGIDNLGRVVGWSTTGGAIPTLTAPFVWTESGGMVDLKPQGFPNEMPLAISPGGAVATPSYWYILGNPASVKALAPPPPGFMGPGNYPAAINDVGDQARFQISTSTENFPYLFRYNHAGTWQAIWSQPAGHLAPSGIGGINASGDISATVGGVGLIAYGPAGVAEPLSAKLSPAYGGGPSSDMTTVSIGGPVNNSGHILAQVLIGRSARLVRLLSAEPCTAGCIGVRSIGMTGRMVGFPRGQCTPRASNVVNATVSVATKTGTPVQSANVVARILDDYYLDKGVTGTTDRDGVVKFAHTGPACVGAIALFIDDVTKSGNVLDTTFGELADYVIPQP